MLTLRRRRRRNTSVLFITAAALVAAGATATTASASPAAADVLQAPTNLSAPQDSASCETAPDPGTSGETLTNAEINIRDTFILVHCDKYYMYGTRGEDAFGPTMDGYDVYVSEDLLNWTGPHEVYHNDGSNWATRRYWAPEVWEKDGRFYFFTAWSNSTSLTQQTPEILSADNPLGPFTKHSGPFFLGDKGNDLTLWTETDALGQEQEYVVLNYRSDTVVPTGEETSPDGMYYVPINDDYTGFTGAPKLMFTIEGCSWCTAEQPAFYHDGAWFYTLENGTLLTLFSQQSAEGYAVGIVQSDNGRLDGNWTHQDELMLTGGGHGMFFTSLEGKLMMAVHVEGDDGNFAHFYEIEEDLENNTLRIVEGSEIFLDETAPEVSAQVDAADRTVTVNATDNSAIPLTVEYRLGATGGWSPYTGPITVGRDAATVQFRATDAAGNVSETGSVDVPAAQPPVFADVQPGHLFYEPIRWLADNGLAEGTRVGEETYFLPTAPMSRQAMAAFLYRYVGSDWTPAQGTQSFTDVAPGHPFYVQIEWMKAEGLAGGYADGTFGATTPVSRQATAAFLHRLAGEPDATEPTDFTDVTPSNQFAEAIEWLDSAGIADGYADGSFGITRPVTRQAMASFLFRYDAAVSARAAVG